MSAAFCAVDPVSGAVHMLAHPFLRDALLAGTAVAVASGLTGYFVALRREIFAGDALSHVAFTGAVGALAAGLDLRIGLYGACIVVAVVLAAFEGRNAADDTVTGIVFAWVLGLGALFLSIYTASHSAGGGTTGVNVLFGSINGLSRGQTIESVAVAAGVVACMLVLARPLLFSSIDLAVARARGIPVRAIGVAFLVLLGITAAEATRVVGALLLLGLLAAPAGAARRLTCRPFRAIALSALIAVASVWGGLALAYAAPRLPPSFTIVAVATAFYLATIAADLLRRPRPRVAA